MTAAQYAATTEWFGTHQDDQPPAVEPVMHVPGPWDDLPDYPAVVSEEVAF